MHWQSAEVGDCQTGGVAWGGVHRPVFISGVRRCRALGAADILQRVTLSLWLRGLLLVRILTAEGKEKFMANSRSALKRIRTAEKRHQRNVAVKSETRTFVRKARTAIDTNTDEARIELVAAISALDRAAKKGVIHANNAARRKSRLMKRFNVAAAVQAAPAAVEAPTAKKAGTARKTAGTRKRSGKK